MDEVFVRRDLIEPSRLRGLSVKSDAMGFLQLGSHLAAIALSTLALSLTLGSWWCVPAFMLKPEQFNGREINVTVELGSELTMGMSVADYWRITDRPKNVVYVRSGDADRYYDLLTERLARLLREGK